MSFYAGVPRGVAAEFSDLLRRRIIPFLVDVWMTDSEATRSKDVVQTTDIGGSYLFDVGKKRLIAAWAISEGRAGHARDKGRLPGHPLSAGPLYHRGHAIAHTLGGGTEINLVPQLGRINVGPFRLLEKNAVAKLGALYFTYWRYPRSSSNAGSPTQTPSGVDQGLIAPNQPPEIMRHGN